MSNFKKLNDMRVTLATQVLSLGGTTNNTAWVDFKNAQRLLLVIQGDAASSGGDITLKQATSAAGAGSKALDFTSIAKIAKATGVEERETVVANSHTLVLDDYTYVLEIDSADLDVQNDFSFIQLQASSLTAADEYSVVAIACDLRFQGNPEGKSLE